MSAKFHVNWSTDGFQHQFHYEEFETAYAARKFALDKSRTWGAALVRCVDSFGNLGYETLYQSGQQVFRKEVA